MRRTNLPSSEELSRMRERLSQIEEQIRRSQLAFNDITISNISGKNLTLTLNIQDKEGMNDNFQIQSRINLPNNTALSHRITEHYSSQQHHRSQHYQKRNELLSSAQRVQESEERQKFSHSKRRQQQFQQASLTQRNRPSLKGYTRDEIPQRMRHKKDEEIVIQDGQQSQIEEESHPHTLTQSNYWKNDAISDRKATEITQWQTVQSNEIKNNLEASNIKYSPNIATSEWQEKSPYSQIRSKDPHEVKIQESPQVLSYLHQEYRKHQPEINTPFQKNPPVKIEIDNLAKPLLMRNLPLILNQSAQNSDGFHQTPIWNSLNTVGQGKKFLKVPSSISKSKVHETQKKNTSNSKSISGSKQPHISSSTKHLNRADALFMERKFKANNNSDTKVHSKYFGEKRVNRLITTNQSRNPSKSSEKHSLSPRISQITQRLYSKQKSPCSHNRRWNESQERQKFTLLVNQNPFVRKHIISSEEKQQLFQNLRASEDSISLWPMKIVNYTYTKLRKSYSVSITSFSS